MLAQGVLATRAEPALNVLGRTVEALSGGAFSAKMLIWTVALGVGVGMAVGAAACVHACTHACTEREATESRGLEQALMGMCSKHRSHRCTSSPPCCLWPALLRSCGLRLSAP